MGRMRLHEPGLLRDMVLMMLLTPWLVCLVGAQTPSAARQAAAKPVMGAPPADIPKGVDTPSDYVIGPEDVLIVSFWREKELSGECIVRPDGMITLPLINDIAAAGLTTDQLREKVMEAAGRFVQDPSATIAVKAINSRNVFIVGQVARPGPYPLTSNTTVIQLIAKAGGLLEYADSKNIRILRSDGKNFRFNYREVSDGKKLAQNILLKPGDTIIVKE